MDYGEDQMMGDEDMDEEYEDHMGQEGMMQEGDYDQEDAMGYGDEEDDADSFGFDRDPTYADFPPLDPKRKVRREVLQTINELREKFKVAGIANDPLTNQAADAYANYLLTEQEN